MYKVKSKNNEFNWLVRYADLETAIVYCTAISITKICPDDKDYLDQMLWEMSGL